MIEKDIGITREHFEKYVAVQMSGTTNMNDLGTVSRLSGLHRDTLIKIIENYSELRKKYNI